MREFKLHPEKKTAWSLLLWEFRFLQHKPFPSAPLPRAGLLRAPLLSFVLTSLYKNKCSNPLWMRIRQGNVAPGLPYTWCWVWKGFSVSWLVWEGANWAEGITTAYLAWEEPLDSGVRCHWALRGYRLCKLCFPSSFHSCLFEVGWQNQN